MQAHLDVLLVRFLHLEGLPLKHRLELFYSLLSLGHGGERVAEVLVRRLEQVVLALRLLKVVQQLADVPLRRLGL